MSIVLVGLSGTVYPEGIQVPILDVPTIAFRQRGFGFREEMAIRDDALGWPSPWKRRRWPQCPSCTHRSKARQDFMRWTWTCRWGHVTHDRDLPRT